MKFRHVGSSYQHPRVVSMVTSPHPGTDSGTPRHERPSHLADLLRLITRDPGRPRLTWYGDDGERVELSGAVLENWVNKTTNLLVEEFDAEHGTRVVLDLPVHWRTMVWASAVWRVGATVVLVPGERAGEAGAIEAVTGSRPDVVVTTRPEGWTGSGADLVAVALPALARRFDGDLPPGAVDAASAVMTYGDQPGWLPAVDLGAPALDGTPAVPHAHLLAAPAGSSTSSSVVTTTGHAGPRRLVDASADGPAEREPLLVALRTWAEDGSVVLARTTDPARLRRIASDERVTA